jgi:hypothetical protein
VYKHYSDERGSIRSPAFRFYRFNMRNCLIGNIGINGTNQILSLRDSRYEIHRELARIHEAVDLEARKSRGH